MSRFGLRGPRRRGQVRGFQAPRRSAWRAPPSSARSSARRTARSATLSSPCPTTTTGAIMTGTGTTRTTTASSATRPAPPPARWPARPTCPSRATCAWPPRAAKRGPWHHQAQEPVPGGLRPRLQPGCREAAYTRGTIDEAGPSDEVKQKFIAEKDLDAETRYAPEPDHHHARLLQGEDRHRRCRPGRSVLRFTTWADKGYDPVVPEKKTCCRAA